METKSPMNADWSSILDQLETGQLRAAVKNKLGKWEVQPLVKQGILEAFRAGKDVQGEGIYHPFIDRHTLMPRQLTPENGIRFVPGGSAIRRGAYVAKGVIIMPPSYINVGAYVDEGTMVDSHVLVGSCAQIGKRVHLSTGAKIGGVLEPIGNSPVIVEDEVFVGAGAILVEGVLIQRRAAIAPGVVLSNSTPLFDVVKNIIHEKGSPIPENSVVVPGTRPFREKYTWARELGLTLQCPIIVKYRDEKSDASLELEEFLR